MTKRKQVERFTLSTNYSDALLKRLMSLKVSGYTYQEISEKLNEEFSCDLNTNKCTKIFHAYKEYYELGELQSHPEKQKKEAQEKLKNTLEEYIKEHNSIPTKSEFYRYGAVKSTLEKHYENDIKVLARVLKNEKPSIFNSILDETSFTKEIYGKIKNRLDKASDILVVSAVNGAEAHLGFLKAINTWKAETKGEVIVLPCYDKAKKKKTFGKWSVDPKLNVFNVLFKDMWINDSLYLLASAGVGAKQLKPATGFKRFVHKRGSFIYASPKQFLEHVPTANANSHRLLATPGAVTIGDYDTDRPMSERSAWMANEDHCLGGIIINIKSKDIFLARNFQAEPDTGNFRDLDNEYRSDGKVKKITASLVAVGDFHCGNHNPEAVQFTKELVQLMKPKYVTFEDFLSGYSMNPHERNRHIKLAKRAKEGELSIESELRLNATTLSEIANTWNCKHIVMKKGNHELFLDRYLDEGDFRPHDRHFAVDLEKGYLDGNDPYRYALETLIGLDKPEKFIWLDLDEEFIINGINNAPHGHLGANGKRNPTLGELENCYGVCNVGHNHSGAVWRNIHRSGTMEHLRAGFNHGPTSWTHSDILQHSNGSRQLITMIGGYWR